jgi:hypothetical protein
MATTAEMKWAIEGEKGLCFDYPRPDDDEWYGQNESGAGFIVSGFDWNDDHSIPGEYFTVRGTEVILAVLTRLCERCGQLYILPDSGAPSIVLDSSLDAKVVTDLYKEADRQEDPWTYFFGAMYGPSGLAIKRRTRKKRQ